MNESRTSSKGNNKRKRSFVFYIVAGVLLLGTVVALGAWRPAADLWDTATMDRAQLWGNVWVNNEEWSLDDERPDRPAAVSDAKIDGSPAALSIREAKLTQCWRGNGEVIASVTTLGATGGLPPGLLQITVTPDKWAKRLPADKQAQQKDRTHVPAEATGHAALNFTSLDGSVTFYGQMAHDHGPADVVAYKDNTWTIRAGLFSPVNSTARLSRFEVKITCPAGR
jgi:hypothetical protein